MLITSQTSVTFTCGIQPTSVATMAQWKCYIAFVTCAFAIFLIWMASSLRLATLRLQAYISGNAHVTTNTKRQQGLHYTKPQQEFNRTDM